MSAGSLKEGYLVKKSFGQHRWKTRWFVLQEENLAYFRKKDRQTLAGAMPLAGAAVCFPVEGYEKRQGVFKVCAYSGRELLLRAPTNEDRQVWSHAIGAVIRAREGIIQMESPQVAKDLSRRLNISDLLGAMQDPDAGIPIVNTRIDDVDYSHCFSGVMVVDWLIRWCFANTREDAAVLSQELLRLAHIQGLKGASRHDAPATSYSSFMDSQNAYYRFSHHNPTTLPLQESSPESSGSSLGDLSEDGVLDGKKNAKGKIVKQGFLMKRGHLRNKWKARRVVLREKPPCLAYYSTSKELDEPLKQISLVAATLPDMSLPEYKDVLPKHRPHILVIRREDGSLMVWQAEDEHDLSDWIKAISQSCT